MKAPCDPFLELLASEPEGLEKAQAEALHEHLAGCAACREAREDLRALDRMAASMSKPAIPLPRIRRTVPVRDWAQTAAALAAGFLLAAALLPTSPEPRSETSLLPSASQILAALAPPPSRDYILEVIPTSDPKITITVKHLIPKPPGEKS